MKKFKHIFLYGLILAILIFVLKYLQWKFLIVDHAMDIYIGLIAVFFTALGIWVSSQLHAPKKSIETVLSLHQLILSDPFIPSERSLEQLNLSPREYEVLQLIAQGLSNADISSQLFLSLSTIKSHVSNLYNKMDVKSRTQAIGKAQELQIIA